MKQRTIITMILPIIFSFIGLISGICALSVFISIGAFMIVLFQFAEKKKRNVILYRELFWSLGAIYFIIALFCAFFCVILIISEAGKQDWVKVSKSIYLLFCMIFNSTIYLFKIRKFKKNQNVLYQSK